LGRAPHGGPRAATVAATEQQRPAVKRTARRNYGGKSGRAENDVNPRPRQKGPVTIDLERNLAREIAYYLEGTRWERWPTVWKNQRGGG